MKNHRNKIKSVSPELISVSLEEALHVIVMSFAQAERSISSLSTKFSGGLVFCRVSITDNDTNGCNKHFWALKNKVVGQGVWKDAKLLGVQGRGQDSAYVAYVGLIEDGEFRDQEVMFRREKAKWVPRISYL